MPDRLVFEGGDGPGEGRHVVLVSGDEEYRSEESMPMQPVAWTRQSTNEAGRVNWILCTTMGSADDLSNEGLRRLVVNGVFRGAGLPVPAKADVTPPWPYRPTFYGFGTFRKGLKPGDFARPAP